MASRDEFLASLAAGAGAGIVVDVTMYPIDTIKTMLQSNKSLKDVGGIRGMYRGISSAAAASAPCAATFFGTYEFTKAALTNEFGEAYAPLCHMTAASAGETAAAVIRTPFEIVKQQLQAKIHDRPTTAVRHIWQTQGFKGFFNGYFSLVLREVPFSFIQFPLYEKFKHLLAEHVANTTVADLPPFFGSCAGAAAGGIAAAITCPLDVVKTRIMVNSDSRGMGAVLMETYQREGMAALFSGLAPRVAWITIGGFVFFGAYESCRKMLTQKPAA
ncbi:uncharacterized protein MONBRDRAFT_32044 [Monosiga brevicollis MX1]|uniref:Mitochondrial carrier protein n=1 Tax=Monosiga brevicollis TaxID=81824 RepID=A9UX16_MONBE|nr:uncharacterized protein MONBRDRAFT_32044 [Monosiga brevicollis MX1]EDQ90313.1 predicted protein [Monosiga brevicollis MX1]|eukprot:XP_001745080.1 hypothetical protein [Monosiga brevicollis MX1]